jgi:hypothetical protein
MCGVDEAAFAAVTLMSLQQQNDAADAQEEALTTAAANSNVQTQIEQMQMNAQASDEVSLRVRQALVERSRLRVAANESGIRGNTVNRLENNVDAQAGWDLSRMETNRASRIKQSNLSNRGRQAGYRSERNQIQRGSPVIAGLQIASNSYKPKK